MNTKRCVKLVLTLVLAISLMFNTLPISNVLAQPELKPTKGWGMFTGTTGDMNITIDEPGVAVRIKIPREFLEGAIVPSMRQAVNDTHFIRSDISNDYYYYKINDTSEYYPYNENAPYNITIQRPPDFLEPDCIVPVYQNFTTPKLVLFEALQAPTVSGIYNISVYIAPNVNLTAGKDFGKPIFLDSPNMEFQVHVSMREDPSHIYGFIIDDQPMTPITITAKGIVYAIEVNTGMIGRGFVDPLTGFFNVTGLYAGEYRLEGSAGYFSTTGFAYSPTLSQTTYIIGRGVGVNAFNLALDRGFNITGSITYVDQLGNPRLPLDTPHLRHAGITELNYTVEAYDESGKIVASRSYQSSLVDTTERYELTYRLGAEYIRYPALGSEFSGFGPGTYTIKIWVYGFTLPPTEVKIVTLSGQGVSVDVGESRLPYGGMIMGTIRLRSGPMGQLETPREGEMNAFGSQTGKLFGGNILVELYGSDGTLKGLTILNRTQADGVVAYADYSSGQQTYLLRFNITGFSEIHNHTYSGTWRIGSIPGPSPWDYGLEPDTYSIQVRIRGYVQEETPVFTIGAGGNQTQTVDLRRGGSIRVSVLSTVVRPGTRWPQQPTDFWRFIDEGNLTLCPPPRIRMYFYSSSGTEIGYSETILALGQAGVMNNSAVLNFTGHNWSIEDIVIRGFVPSALTSDDYTVRAHTYGYIQAEDVSVTITLTQFSPTHVNVHFPLLLGCFIKGDSTFSMNDLFIQVDEDVTIRPQVFTGGLPTGVDVVDVPTGSPGFSFATYGYYGRGHFFYIEPNGDRWKDYGLDSGTYTINVPEFGYTRRFIHDPDVYVNLAEIGWGTTVGFSLDRLVKITGVVNGYDKDRFPVVLVWATVESDSRIAYTFDGDFHVHVLPGTYDVTFSSPGYIPQSRTGTSNDQVSLGTIILEQSGDPFP